MRDRRPNFGKVAGDGETRHHRDGELVAILKIRTILRESPLYDPFTK